MHRTWRSNPENRLRPFESFAGGSRESSRFNSSNVPRKLKIPPDTTYLESYNTHNGGIRFHREATFVVSRKVAGSSSTKEQSLWSLPSVFSHFTKIATAERLSTFMFPSAQGLIPLPRWNFFITAPRASRSDKHDSTKRAFSFQIAPPLLNYVTRPPSLSKFNDARLLVTPSNSYFRRGLIFRDYSTFPRDRTGPTQRSRVFEIVRP